MSTLTHPPIVALPSMLALFRVGGQAWKKVALQALISCGFPPWSPSFLEKGKHGERASMGRWRASLRSRPAGGA
jgi:hypothetical protein